jgi:hypothetical protein
MGWSGEEARRLQRPTTHMKTNEKQEVSVQKKVSAAAAATPAVSKELFLGLDVADARHVVTRFVPGEGTKPAEGMSTDTVIKRVGNLLKEGFRVHCVYEAGPTASGGMKLD